MRGMRRDVPVPIPTCFFYAPMATSLPFLVLILQLAMSSPGSFRDPDVWNSAEWQAITRTQHAPWSPHATPTSTRLPAGELAALKAFVERYASITDGEERARFAVESKFNGRTDEENVGRFVLVRSLVGPSWQIDLMLKDLLERHGFDARQLKMQGVSSNMVCIRCVLVCAGCVLTHTMTSRWRTSRRQPFPMLRGGCLGARACLRTALQSPRSPSSFAALFCWPLENHPPRAKFHSTFATGENSDSLMRIRMTVRALQTGFSHVTY